MDGQHKTTILAGGCFWGVQEILRSYPGIIKTEVGYTGGERTNPTYEQVCKGDTGHAEAIKVTYDVDTVSFKDILRYFFRLHNPTTKNQQGNDIGSQYRSAIFYQTEDEKKEAEEVITEAQSWPIWKDPIVTTLEPMKPFYSAEKYHQDYLQKNPGGYSCHFLRPLE